MKEELILEAEKAAQKSYSPYSKFRVGAAIKTSSGKIFIGTNVENRSYGLTCCAERSALFAAVSAGEREFTALGLFCLDADYPVPPCGACRQVLSEFFSPNTPVYYGAANTEIVTSSMEKLLPNDSLHELKK